MDVQLVSKDEHRAQDGEELASGGEDGAGQRTKLGYGDKDEHLDRRRSQRDVPINPTHATPLYLSQGTSTAKC